MKKCPIQRFKAKLLSMGMLTDEEDHEIREKIASQVEEAVKFAMESPYPPLEEALKDLYA